MRDEQILRAIFSTGCIIDYLKNDCTSEVETAVNAIPGDGKDLTPEMPASLNDTSLYVSLFLS